jgi:abhydrolase domain-containing protein 6
MGAIDDVQHGKEMSEAELYVHEIVVAGISTAYYERGEGPPLILVHGMFGDFTDWETVLELLSRNFRVIAPDLPGFGRSGKPDVDYNADLFVRWMEALVVVLGVDKATMVGNSFGGEVVILYALAHPERVRRLVLVSSGGLRSYGEDERALLREKFSIENLKTVTPKVHEFLFRPVFAEKGAAWQRYLQKQNAKLARTDHEAYARSLHRSMNLAFSLYFDEELRRLWMPVLLVWGDRDIVFPIPLAERALTKLRHGEFVLLERAGHAPQLEDPEGFAAAVERFVFKDGSVALETSGTVAARTE